MTTDSDMPADNNLNLMRNLADNERPREKALNFGFATLSDAELLAIILRTGRQGRSVIELSREILARCDNRLGTLSRMTANEICRDIKGIGPTKAITLLAAIELGSRCAADLTSDRPQITGSESIYRLMRGQLERINHEEFWILTLNRANRVTGRCLVSRGGTAATVVDAKIVFRQALDRQAQAIVLLHNHPSGNLRPSAEDNRLTEKLKSAATLLDITVLDHIIITPGGYYSYHDEGKL